MLPRLRHVLPFLMLIGLTTGLIAESPQKVFATHAFAPTVPASFSSARTTQPVLPQSALAEADSCTNAWQVAARRTIGGHYSPGLNSLQDIDVHSANDIWAAGIQSVAGRTEALVQHWDGTRWSIENTPRYGNPSNYLDTALLGITAIANNNVWAVGYINNTDRSETLILHWDGAQWSRVPSPNHPTGYNRLHHIAGVSANDIWAVGEDGGRMIIMRWNGATWSFVARPDAPSGNTRLRSVTALGPNDVWAVGSNYYNTSTPLILHWNGTTWTIVSNQQESGELYDVVALASNDIWAVGDQNGRPLAMHWNGTAWTTSPTPSDINLGYNYIWGVDAAASNDVWAVGNASYEDISLHWDGTSWQMFTHNQGEAQGLLRDVGVVAADNVWAVGGVRQAFVSRYQPKIELSNTMFSTREDAGTAKVTVSVKPPAVQPVSIGYSTQSGSASASSDYTNVSGTLTLAACETSKTLSIPITDDAVFEGPETLGITISNAQNARLGARQAAQLSIFDTDDGGTVLHLPAISHSVRSTGRIAFMSERTGNREIYVMNDDGSGQQRLTNHPAEDAAPAWSPDGQRIAFQSSRDGNSEIYVMQADGSDVRRLTINPADDRVPVWSPDGQRIAYASSSGNLSTIWVMNTDGSAPKQLTTPDKGDQLTRDTWPAWAPDGQHIVFIGGIPNGAWYSMYLMNADGSQLRRIVNSAAEMIEPTWAPDGQTIAFSVGSMPMFNLYTIRADGTMVTRVNEHFDTGMYPSWSPQGDRLAYSDGRIFATRRDHGQPMMLSQPTTSWSDYDPAWSPR